MVATRQEYKNCKFEAILGYHSGLQITSLLHNEIYLAQN